MTEVTYGQLDRALRLLGFSAHVLTSKPKARVYEHKDTGALISLAYHGDRMAIEPHHLLAVQGTLKVFGIADPLDFTAQAQKAG